MEGAVVSVITRPNLLLVKARCPKCLKVNSHGVEKTKKIDCSRGCGFCHTTYLFSIT